MKARGVLGVYRDRTTVASTLLNAWKHTLTLMRQIEATSNTRHPCRTYSQGSSTSSANSVMIAPLYEVFVKNQGRRGGRGEPGNNVEGGWGEPSRGVGINAPSSTELSCLRVRVDGRSGSMRPATRVESL